VNLSVILLSLVPKTSGEPWRSVQPLDGTRWRYAAELDLAVLAAHGFMDVLALPLLER
jgi:hypothetical protein